MPLTSDELQSLETAAYLCDGEPFSVFQQSVLPKLAMHSECELWTLAGMFTGRHMLETARFIADYARAVGQVEGEERQPPDPVQFLREWEAEQQEIAAIELPFTRGTATIQCELDESGGAMSLNIDSDDPFLALLRGPDGERLRGNVNEQCACWHATEGRERTMSHTNGSDASQARVEELQRHIRVLESYLPDTDYGEGIHYEISRLGVDQRERHDKVLGVLNSMLTKLNELVDAQNRTAGNFALLLAGLRLAPPPAPPPQPPSPQPGKVVRLRRKQ